MIAYYFQAMKVATIEQENIPDQKNIVLEL